MLSHNMVQALAEPFVSDIRAAGHVPESIMISVHRTGIFLQHRTMERKVSASWSVD